MRPTHSRSMTPRLLPRLFTIICLGFTGCGTLASPGTPDFAYKNMAVADGSAVAGDGNKVLFQGKPMALSGMGIKVGDSLRDVKLVQTDLSMVVPIGEYGRSRE